MAWVQIMEKRLGTTLLAKISQEAAMPAQSSKGSKKRTFTETRAMVMTAAWRKEPTRYPHKKLGKSSSRRIEITPASSRSVREILETLKMLPVQQFPVTSAPRLLHAPKVSITNADIITEPPRVTCVK